MVGFMGDSRIIKKEWFWRKFLFEYRMVYLNDFNSGINLILIWFISGL
jgi:hypothetical protein